MEETIIAPVVTEEVAVSDQGSEQVVSTPDAQPIDITGKDELAPAVSEVTPTEVDKPKEDKQLANAIKEVEKKNAAYQRVVGMQANLVAENPDLIHKIASSDPTIADQVVEKVWGESGVRSYKQLIERAKLEELKTSNPDLYETKLEMSTIRAELEERRTKELTDVKNKFLKEKGILENEYDPKYTKLIEALNLVNPAVLEKDLRQGLETAHSIAFAKGMPKAPVHIPEGVSIGSGQPMDLMPNSKPNVSDQSAWLANSLNKVGGYKIKF
jgi:hypothetical protein